MPINNSPFYRHLLEPAVDTAPLGFHRQFPALAAIHRPLPGQHYEKPERLGNLKQTPEMPHHFTLRITALLLITAGYGWAGGHFIPTNAPFWAYLFQFVMLFLLSFFTIGYLKAVAGYRSVFPTTPTNGKRNIIGLTTFASLTILINIANVIRGSLDPGPFGSHNDFADLVPIGLIVAGDLLWLLTTILRPKLPLKKTAEN
jgi:hypothetical protein